MQGSGLNDRGEFTETERGEIGQTDRRCRISTIKDVAEELHRHWKSVKTLEKQYMRAQLRRVGTPAPRAIRIDEISIRKGHTYRIVVSDLEWIRPIWFGGTDRWDASMDEFFTWQGPKKCRRMQLAVMDLWKACRNSTMRHAPQASILFDKFHIMRHLGEALDTVRKREYARVSGKDRRFIKGQKYMLRSHRENLTLDMDVARSSNCWRRTSGSPPPTCSKSPSASCGITSARAGQAASSRTGRRR